MTDDDAVLERLDLMVATLKLAFSDEIAAKRDQVRSEPVSAAILDEATEKLVTSGELKTKVAAATNVNARTVQRRLQDLVALGALRQNGAGTATAYRSTGLL